MSKQKASQKISNASQSLASRPMAKKILNAAMATGASFLAYKFIAKPMWQKYKQTQENSKVLSDPNSQLASRLRTAIIGVGTDEKTVFNVAHSIKNWAAVQSAYQNLTGNNLNQDLHEDLSSSQYSKFMAIVSHSLAVSSATSKKGYIVVSKKAIRLRSTPDSTISAWSFNSNILDTIQADHFLGFATGIYKTDDEGVLYYQVRIKYIAGIPTHHKKTYDKLKNKILTYWVGAGAVDLIKEWKDFRANYPQVKLYKGTKDTGLRQALK